MTARILDGKRLSADIVGEVASRSHDLKALGLLPHLVIVLIGDSPSAEIYVRHLERLGKKAGVLVSRHAIGGDANAEVLEQHLAALDADKTVDGIVIQMPLPDHLHVADISGVLDERKDVDGITIQNAGRLYLNLPGQRPSTAAAIMSILRAGDVEIAGTNAVVVGRSAVVGHPVAEMLLSADSTVTIVHRKTRDLAEHTRGADILIVAAGQAGLISPGMVKPGAVIVDAGITAMGGTVVGDVQHACREVAAAMTPVPGGVGPVTNAILLRNTVESAERRNA